MKYLIKSRFFGSLGFTRVQYNQYHKARGFFGILFSRRIPLQNLPIFLMIFMVKIGQW